MRVPSLHGPDPVSLESLGQQEPPRPPGLTSSVVICAYTLERWDDLCSAVSGVLQQEPPADQVVVVIDHHEELLDRALSAWSDDRVVVVANGRARGLSGARNTALERVTGDVVVFLDDDATPTEGWLSGLLSAYADPTVAGVGGWTIPVWPAGHRRPAHLVPELDWIVGCSYAGLPQHEADVRNLMGCNMSFRRQALAGLGGFREDAGRIGSIPLGCEETELCIRLTQRDPTARLRLAPGARVEHTVTLHRVTWSYLRERSWAEGLSKAAMSQVVGSRDALSSERAYVRSALPQAMRRELTRLPSGGLAGAAGVLVSLLWTAAGYARGRWRARRRDGLLARDVARMREVS